MIKELLAQLMFRQELSIKPKSDINSRASHCQQYFDFFYLLNIHSMLFEYTDLKSILICFVQRKANLTMFFLYSFLGLR